MIGVAAENTKSAGHTLAQDLVGRISERILDGAYRPGERLVEAALAAEFEVGRGSIREALRRLEANRYVSFAPNRGAMVASPDADQIADMLRIREVNSGLAARAAAERIEHPGNREIARALSQMIEDERQHGTPAGHRACNERFHARVLDLAGVDGLAEILQRIDIPMLHEAYCRELTREEWQDNLDDHHDILRAILAGDGEAAELIARRHVRRMIGAAKKAFAQLTG